MDGVLGDAGKHVGEPRLGIDVVHPRGDDQAVLLHRPVAAAIRSGKQPRATSQGNAPQRPFRGVVGQADPAIVQEPRERGLALEHVVDGLGDIVVARQPGALLLHPGVQLDH